MLNQGEEFTYLLCKNCGTLQLVDEINDIGNYYQRYPVFKMQKKRIQMNWVKQCYVDVLLSKFGKYIRRIPLYSEELNFIDCLIGLGIKKTENTVLDIGCGDGSWLQKLESIGFSNLCGIDKYVPDEMLKSKCEFYKGEILEFNREGGRKFDLIALHHSFEHMQDPENVLRKVKSLLNDSGICIVRIPVMGKIAWKKYKTNWYQIDAPRHAFLYTEKALELLCEKAGLKIFDIKYDSQYGQFYVSEQYSNCKKSFSQICAMHMSRKDIKKYKKWSRLANKRKEGDQAIFYIKKVI